jgi:trigger factor
MLISCTEAAKGGKDVTSDETTASDGGGGVPDTDMTKPYYGDYFAYDLSEFIRIPSLSDVKVKSEDVDALYKANMAKALTSLNLLNDVASEGITELYDTVNIDFEGVPEDPSVNMSAEDLAGMKSSGYSIMLGSGSFIGAYDHKSDDSLDTKGFEEQMVGMKVGQTKDILVTFPSDYHKATFADLRVIFTVKINSAKRPCEMTDAVAVAQGYKDAAEFNKKTLDTSKEQLAFEAFINSCEIVSYPVGDLELLEEYYIESYINSYYGPGIPDETREALTLELRPGAQIWAKSFARERMAVKALFDSKNISLTEKELLDYADEQAKAFGIDSGNTLIAYYGKDTVWYDWAYYEAVKLVSSGATYE